MPPIDEPELMMRLDALLSKASTDDHEGDARDAPTRHGGLREPMAPLLDPPTSFASRYGAGGRLLATLAASGSLDPDLADVGVSDIGLSDVAPPDVALSELALALDHGLRHGRFETETPADPTRRFQPYVYPVV